MVCHNSSLAAFRIQYKTPLLRLASELTRVQCWVGVAFQSSDDLLSVAGNERRGDVLDAFYFEGHNSLNVSDPIRINEPWLRPITLDVALVQLSNLEKAGWEFSQTGLLMWIQGQCFGWQAGYVHVIQGHMNSPTYVHVEVALV